MNSRIILAIITTFATILSQITKYYLNVKNVKQDRERFHKEVKVLHHILKNVQNMIKNSNVNKLLNLFSYFKENCFLDIKNLEIKLDPRKNQKTMMKLDFRVLK